MVSQAMQDGVFKQDKMTLLRQSSSIIILFTSFIELTLLYGAIHAQWNVEPEYSIRYEILLITIVWFICSEFINYAFVAGINHQWLFASNSSRAYINEYYTLD